MRVKLFFDKADLAAAFHACESDLGKVVEVCGEAHVFFQIVNGDVVAPHRTEIASAIAHDHIRAYL
jgi:hypothetical protein